MRRVYKGGNEWRLRRSIEDVYEVGERGVVKVIVEKGRVVQWQN